MNYLNNKLGEHAWYIIYIYTYVCINKLYMQTYISLSVGRCFHFKRT